MTGKGWRKKERKIFKIRLYLMKTPVIICHADKSCKSINPHTCPYKLQTSSIYGRGAGESQVETLKAHHEHAFFSYIYTNTLNQTLSWSLHEFGLFKFLK